jgi:hypothetical protein
MASQSNMAKKTFLTVCLAGLLGVSMSQSVVAAGLYSRDLGCTGLSPDRARVVCSALEQALEWTWTGHAIISPSFRMGLDGVREVYCTLPVTTDDSWILAGIAVATQHGGMRALQLNIGAQGLLSLLGQPALDRLRGPGRPGDLDGDALAALSEALALAIAEDSPSVFNPGHPHYILRNGCE